MVEAIVVKLRFLCTETVYVHRHLHTWFQPALGAERTKGLNWNGDPLNHCLDLCAIQLLLLHEYRDEVGDLFIVLTEHEVRHIAPLVQDALHLAIDDSHHRWATYRAHSGHGAGKYMLKRSCLPLHRRLDPGDGLIAEGYALDFVILGKDGSHLLAHAPVCDHAPSNGCDRPEIVLSARRHSFLLARRRVLQLHGLPTRRQCAPLGSHDGSCTGPPPR